MWHLFLVFTDQIFGITRCFPIQIIYYSDSTTGWFCVRIRFRSYGFTSLDLWYVEDEDYFGDVTWHLFLILGSNFWHCWTMFLDSHYFYPDYILWMLHIFSRLFFEEFRCIMIRELEMFFRLLKTKCFFYWIFYLLMVTSFFGWLWLVWRFGSYFFCFIGCALKPKTFISEIHGQFQTSQTLQSFRDISALDFILLPHLLVGLLYYSLVSLIVSLIICKHLGRECWCM